MLRLENAFDEIDEIAFLEVPSDFPMLNDALHTPSRSDNGLTIGSPN
jgi:hypothetical protein